MKRILLVENDALLNKTLAYNLISDGWEVTPALNARTAENLPGREVIRPGAAGHQFPGQKRP